MRPAMPSFFPDAYGSHLDGRPLAFFSEKNCRGQSDINIGHRPIGPATLKTK
jgi:hypothetical protein